MLVQKLTQKAPEMRHLIRKTMKNAILALDLLTGRLSKRRAVHLQNDY